MNRIVGILSVFILVSSFLTRTYSQTKASKHSFEFKVINARTHKPLHGVTCRIYSKNGKMYTYRISDVNGCMNVFANAEDSLEFAAIGYETRRNQSRDFSEESRNIIRLSEKNIELKEVTIRIPPIQKRNDTISYNAKSFIGAGDSHLEDILRKMPGIKVNDDGSISYQGKAINKFYIEGKDLMGNRYNQATRNMPVEAVNAIEVIENHQPLQLLRGKQFSDKAALNIKIDKSHSLHPFGEADCSIDAKGRTWNNSLFLTYLTDKKQMLINAKMNNAGIDISDETKEHIDITDIESYEPSIPNVIHTSEINSENIPQQWYIKNKSHSIGTNILTSISKTSSLRTNLFLYSDHSFTSSFHEYIYGGQNVIRLSEYNNQKARTLSVIPVVRLELNEKKYYLVNTLSGTIGNDATNNSILANGLIRSQNTKNKPLEVKNNMAVSFGVGEYIIHAKSMLRHFRRTEQLLVDRDSMSQSFSYGITSTVNKNSVYCIIPCGKNTLNLKLSTYYRNQSYNYKLETNIEDFHLNASPTFDWQIGTKNILSIELPLQMVTYSVLLPSGKHNGHNLSLNPSFYLKHEFSDKWKITTSFDVSTDNSTADFYSDYPIHTGYRTIQLTPNELFFTKSIRTTCRLSYQNLATMLFANLSVAYKKNNKEFCRSVNYTDSVTEISTVKFANTDNTLMANLSADKRFPATGISLKSNINFNQTEGIILQSGVQTENRSNILSGKINLSYNISKALSLSFETTAQMFWEQNKVKNSGVSRNIQYKGIIHFILSKDWHSEAEFTNVTAETDNSRYKTYSMLNLCSDFKLSKEINIGLVCKNLLNTKEYFVGYDSGINRFYSLIPLRHRTIMIKAALKIK